jgi:hypothetical protein
MWADGLTPYLKHLYEYPPLTIPLVYFPEALNRLDLGHYYQNYRFQIFLIDLLFSFFIIRQIVRLKIPDFNRRLALGFYLAAPVIAKDFFYDGIDWLFSVSFALALIFWGQKQLFWLWFWLSTGIKLLTAPLAAVFLKRDWRQMLLGFILIWGLPLLLFRSSLSVIWTYNNARGIKYASFPNFIVEVINQSTHSETRREQPPDFELIGPVSTTVQKIVGLVFPLSILAVIIYGWRLPQTYPAAVKISLVYFLTIFFTAKIFSQPFHLWYVPLIVLFPFKNLKQQFLIMALALILLVVDTTPWIRYPNEFKLQVYFWLRYLPMAGLLWQSIKLPSA